MSERQSCLTPQQFADALTAMKDGRVRQPVLFGDVQPAPQWLKEQFRGNAPRRETMAKDKSKTDVEAAPLFSEQIKELVNCAAGLRNAVEAGSVSYAMLEMTAKRLDTVADQLKEYE